MNLLGIETSCEVGSVALQTPDGVLERILPGGGSAHSGSVLPAIKTLLAEAQMSVSQLDAIAFGQGPGAFTGVRLACGIAQGLALGAGLPIAAIGSLDALAWAHRGESSQIYVAMDARMNEVYVASFVADAKRFECLAEPVCVPPESLPDAPSGECLFVGNAHLAYAQRMPAALSPERIKWLHDTPRARAVVSFAAHRQQDWHDPADVAPLYVRNRVALTVAERLAQGGKA